MSTGGMQALVEQNVSRAKKAMFRAAPGTKEHLEAVIAYDKAFVELNAWRMVAATLHTKKG